MRKWTTFFFGTPQRFLVTLAGIVALAVFTAVFPGTLAMACNRLVAELSPIVLQAIQLVFVAAVLGYMLKAVFGK